MLSEVLGVIYQYLLILCPFDFIRAHILFSEQDAQHKTRSSPPPPKKKNHKKQNNNNNNNNFTFIEQNYFLMQQNQQDFHISDHSDAFCSHPVCKRSYKRPKCALISYRSRNISHGFLLHPVVGHSDEFNL